MDKAGRSVLWFLGACLAMTEVVAGLVLRTAYNDSYISVLVYALIGLFSVLFTLLYLYRRDPAYLLAENIDVMRLETLRAVAAQSSPALLREFILHVDPNLHEVAEAASVEVDELPAPEDEENESLEALLQEREELTKTLQSLAAGQEEH